MASDPIDALPPFLHFLTAFPAPDDVAEALSRGPLGGLRPHGLSIFERVAGEGGDEIVVIGRHDTFEAVDDRYARLPLSLDLPVTEAVAQARAVITPMTQMVRDYRPLELDADLWEDVAEMGGLSGGMAVSAPVIARGHSIGAITFLTPHEAALGPGTSRILDILGHVLGLWLAERQAAERAKARRASPASLSLTPRQAQILLLIEQGKGNESIAAALGFSRSTVKLDIRQMMSSLRCESRQDLVERARELSLLPDTRPRAV